MRLKIQKLDPGAQLKQHRIILFVGRRGTGKSRLAEDIMYRIKDNVDFGLAMTPTEDTASMLRSHMPDSWVYSAFSCQKIEQMMAMQRQNIVAGKPRDLFLICDDCTYDKKVWRSTAIRDLFLNGRHARITFLMSSQYIMDLTPDLRNNIDYVFCLKQSIIAEKRKLHTYFFGMFEKFDDFSRVMDRCCDNYGCIVLDNTAPTNKLEDCIFWYRSRIDLPPFQIGKEVFRRLAQKHHKRDEARVHSVPMLAKDKRITSVERTDARGRTIDEDKDVIVE